MFRQSPPASPAIPRTSEAAVDATLAGIAADKLGRKLRRKPRGCIYARYSTRFQQSIEDQVRTCREWATANGIDVADCHIFVDIAKTAKSRRRAGFQAMMDALNSGEVEVVLTFATNRLNRRIHLALKFVEEQLVEKRRRCIFVAQNIDTENTQFWKQLLYVFAMLDEFQVDMARSHIKAAHIGLTLKKFVTTTMTFGYTGIEIPDQFTKRGRARLRWEIDAASKEWVIKIFNWFVEERMTYRGIARRLRKEGASRPPKAPGWTSLAVRYALMNRRYIADWSYGWRETIWQSGADYARQFSKEKPTHEHRDESLRIIPDELFHRAAQRIAKRLGMGGRPSHKGDRRPDFLREILVCPEHKCRLSLYSGGGGRMACAACKAEGGKPTLFSSIDRVVGRRLFCKAIADAVRQVQGVTESVTARAIALTQSLQQPDAAQKAVLESDLQRIDRKIAFVFDSSGESATDEAENRAQLRSLRAKRAGLQAELAVLMAAVNQRREVPSVDEINGLLSKLTEVLDNAAVSTDDAEVGAVMRVMVALTGGKVELSQHGEPSAQRGWLRGTFQLHLIDTLLTNAGFSGGTNADVVVTVDFREPDPFEKVADQAVELMNTGVLIKQIAKMLSAEHGKKIGRNLVARAIAHWHQQRGLPVPDGRTRRSTLEVKHLDPPLYQKVADQVVELSQKKILLGDIAKQLGIDRNTVTSAVEYWHKKHGLPLPPGQGRRKPPEDLYNPAE